MQYCMNGSSVSDGWIHGGINLCIVDSVSSTVVFCYILVVSIIVHCTGKRKKKPAADQEDPCAIPPSERPWDSILRIVLGVMLLVEAVLHAVAQDTLTLQKTIAGFQLLTATLLLCTWVMFVRLEIIDIPAAPNPTEKRNKQRSRWLLLVFICLAIIKEFLAFVSWSSTWFWWSLESTSDEIEFGLWLVRTVCSLLLLTLRELPQHLCPASDHTPVSTDDKKKWKKKTREESTWTNVFVKLRMMVPYVFPKDSFSKQVLLCVCVVILGVGRGVNLLVPIVSKSIVNDLSTKLTEESSGSAVSYEFTNTSIDSNKTRRLVFESVPILPNLERATNWRNDSMETKEETGVEVFESGPVFCWREIIIYCFLMFLKGGGAGHSGLLNNIRSFCWVPVQQYTTKKIQVNLFHHLQCLSLRWHLQRRTGEVLRIVDRGTNSVNVLLSHLLFQVLPIIADITIAIVYFISTFNYLFGLVVFLCMAFYVGVSFVLTEWRTKHRRDMNKLDNEKNAKAVDALLNFETVKYYGASGYEKDQYSAAITKHQKAELVSNLSLHILNTSQNIVICFGLVSGSLMCAWAVVYSIKGLHLTVGDYVLFGTYLNQLYGPLQWLGNYYRLIQQSFVDMENMFDLFQEKQEITDVKDAEDINVTDGRIEFKDVCFHYDPSKKILTNISFCAPPGQTYALVGHSGSGKSTVIRLLFRFYDITSGIIEIDGQDISKVKQESLRQCIGIVPQDTVLFNEDIKYNIRYGKVCATDEDIIEAADAADIHDRILNFPNQYDTLVGERGLKLSGGEKQRVAIARTLLKSPIVVLLDEATSALDTKTERNIQKSLARVCDNRTTIVVAHRLSTIVNADQILVMREGEIIERGCHQELLKQNGHYADMWQQQLQWEKDQPTRKRVIQTTYGYSQSMNCSASKCEP